MIAAPVARVPMLDGLDPDWSRWVEIVDETGTRLTCHVLDSRLGGAGAETLPVGTLTPSVGTVTPSVGTVLCVHGNPTWSYLWRRLVAAPPPGWRVVAVDQIGMGFSDRPSGPRRLATRIDDLAKLTTALGISGPVVTVAHDWGGPISLGWARDHRDQLAGVVLLNTAVHQPAEAAAPALIRLARIPGVRQLICQWTSAFVRTTAALSHPGLRRSIRAGLAAPYRRPDRRRAIADFVADIPLDDRHPSMPTLESIVHAMPALTDVPALLLWGPRDPVFSDRHLRDLTSRLPHADVHRFEGASHLVLEDRPDAAEVIAGWVSARAHPVRPRVSRPDDGRPASRDTGRHRPSLWSGLTERRDDATTAVLEAGGRSISFAELNRRVGDIASGLQQIGVRRGHRVVLLIPPGIDLTATVYACWQQEAVVVVADAGLGLGRLGRALRGAGGDWLIGSARGLAAARALRVPGRRIVAGPVPGVAARALADWRLDEVAALGRLARRSRPAGYAAAVQPDADCAVVFTSGATGPPKGVLYRVEAVQRQITLLKDTYGITADDRLVAAFAPFALYGPALGITSAVPAMDVTAPATLTARALADAVAAVDATVVFASPAALANVVSTAPELSDAQRADLGRPRLVMSAGAPLPVPLLRAVASVLPGAAVHTPYGMTEVLPVTDVSLPQLEEAATGRGVCVGLPVAGTRVAISALDGRGNADADPDVVAGISGEVCVRAPHGKTRYDQLWATEADAARNPGWHRTGDVGHLDDAGRLWIEGRLADVVLTDAGPVTPVPLEQRIQALPDVVSAAVVGIGPPGAQQVVAVVTISGSRRGSRMHLADIDLADRVRAAAGTSFAAVLTTARLPVDIRHNSKINHAGVARAAGALLAGHGAPRAARR